MSRVDHFLARWSRLKRTSPAAVAKLAPATEAAPSTEAVPAVVDAPALDQASAANQDQAADHPAAAVALPDPASLTLDSDFTAFLKAEVGDAVRRQALKKLFNDPHFNVMDGLDIYIDDYSVSAPIPPELLAKLRSASEWLAGRDQVEAAPDAVAGQAAERAAPVTEADPLADAAPPSTPGASADDAAAVTPGALAPAADHDPDRAHS